MQISEKVARLKADFDGVYDRGYKSGMENSENYKAGYAEAEAITRGIIDGTITELVIPDGTTNIRGYAFGYCLALKKITIPEGVTFIDGSALSVTGLVELDFPMSCNELAAWCIYDNQYLKRIRFGDVRSIGANAFRNDVACTEYDFKRCSTVPSLADINAFTGINANAKILVPAKLYYDWIAATNWAEYADYIAPDGLVPSRGLEIDSDGNLVGRGTCTDTVIVVPDEVKRIAMYSFVDDPTLDTLILPERETGVYISDYSVYGSGLRVVENFYRSDSLSLVCCPLELVTFLPSADYIILGALNLSSDATYDFTRHTAVPQLDAWSDYYTVSEGTRFLVPASLYDEWITDSNWTLIQPYIFPVETE